MMPKNSRLTRKVRITIMLSLITAFFIISPLLLLYAGGYRFDFKEFTVLKKGVISIDIEPPHATVYINKIKVIDKLPIRLTDSAPGTYHIKIEAEGYHTWEKDSVVESNKTTYIRDITLPKISSPEATEFFSRIDTPPVFLESPTDSYAIYNQISPTTTDIYLYDTDSNESTLLVTSPGSSLIALTWSPYAPMAYMVLSKNGVNSLHLIDAKAQTISAGDTLLDGDTYHWSKQNNESLFLTKATFETYNIATSETTFVGNASSSQAYVLNSNTIASLSTSEEGNSIVYFSDELLPSPLPKNIDSITLLTEALLIGKSDNTTHVFHRDKQVFTLKDSLEGTTFTKYGNRDFIISSPWQIWTVNPNGEITLLFRTSDPVQNIIPFDDQGVLLLTTEKGLSLFNPGYYTTTQLLEANYIKATILDRSSDSIIFSSTIDGVTDLYRLEY